MIEDAELLRRYAENRSEEAFGELVRRHLNLVYSAALRQVGGDPQLAEDVAQTVFLDLSRKAAALSRRPVLTGWLYTGAHFAAAKIARTGQRRQAREQEAHAMYVLERNSEPDLDWTALHPVLDSAMHELNEADRQAILLRYFEGRPLAEIGAKLGLKENAARMRVERALEKLRVLLGKRGIWSGTSELAVELANQSIGAAPAGLIAKITAATAASAVIGGGAEITLMKIMTMSKLKIAATSVLLAASAMTALHFQHQAAGLRTELAAAGEQTTATAAELARLEEENQRLSKMSVAVEDEMAGLRKDREELVRLRGEVGRLRNLAEDLQKARNSGQNVPVTAQTPQNDSNPTPKLTGRTIYELARQNQLDTLRSMLNAHPELVSEGGGPFSSTPLHTASGHHLMEIVDELLRHHANVNAQNEMGATPLHDVIKGDGSPGSGKEIAEALIRNGADVSIKDHAGKTPLAFAIEKNQNEIVEILRQAGAKQ